MRTIDSANLSNIILLTLSFSIITALLAFNLIQNKRQNHTYFTTKKIVVIGMFFSIFLIQSSFTIFQNDFSMLFNFDSMLIVVISIIFGPIEGFVFAIVGDNLRTLINGWTWQLFYSIILPVTALISGTIGRIFIIKHLSFSVNKDFYYKKRYQSFFIVQFIIASIFSLNVFVNFYFSDVIASNINLQFFFSTTLIVSTIIFLLFYELALFILFLLKQYKLAYLVSFLFLIILLDRYMLTIWLSSQADANLWAPNFATSFIPRIYKTLYQTPINIFLWLTFILISWKVFIEGERKNGW